MLDFVFRNTSEFNSAEFDEFFALLESGLLPLEYRSYQNQKKLLKNENYNILFCKDGKKVVGALAFWYVGDFVFVEHFVVRKGFRNLGFSTMISNISNHR